MAGRELLRDLVAEAPNAAMSSLISDDRGLSLLPSIREYADRITVSKKVEIIGVDPQLLSTETDQTSPAGRYRWHGINDVYELERMLTADYATYDTILYFSKTGSAVTQTFGQETRITYLDGTSEIWHATGTKYRPSGSAASMSFDIGGLNSAGTFTALLRVLNRNDPTGVDAPYLDFMNARPVWFSGDLMGRSDTTWSIYPNRGVSTSTPARRIALNALDDTGNAFIVVAQIVPNNATPFFTSIAPNAAPTTSELDASNLTFRYTSGGALTAYVNDGGTVRSLSLGTPA